MLHYRLSGSLLCFFFLFASCGPAGSKLDTHFVEGVVTVEGEPAKGAFVSFEPVTKGNETETAAGFTDEKGNYKLTSTTGDPEKGALAGDYIVTIACYENIEKKGKDEMGEEVIFSTQKLIVPEKYTNAKTSPFKATVVKGENKFDFDISK